MKVLQIVRGMDIGGRDGGGEKFGLELTRELKTIGIDVRLCSLSRSSSEVEKKWITDLTDKGIEVFFACPAPKVDLHQALSVLKAYIRKNDISLVHSQSQRCTVIMVLLKIFGGIKHLVRTAHTPLEFGVQWYQSLNRLVFIQFIYPIIVDVEVGVSGQIVNNLNNRPLYKLMHRNAIKIYNGIPDSVVESQADDLFTAFRSGLLKNEWIITAAGLMRSYKRFDIAIKSMPMILKGVPQARLALAGDGPELAHLKQLAHEIGVTDQVWFMGQQDNIPAILRESHLFVLPSQIEGLSTVVLEAMAAGVPIIVSDIEGNLELIKNGFNGWVFKLGEPDQLAHAVLDAFHHPELCRLYRENSMRVLENFYFHQIVRQYCELYKKLEDII